MTVKTALSVLLAIFTLTACAKEQTAAELTMENALLIESSNSMNDVALEQLRQDLASCDKNDNHCRGKTTFTYFENAFADAGYSQIKTMKKYLDWASQQKGPMPDMTTAQTLIKWSELLLGASMCLKSQECSDWLVTQGHSNKDEISKIRPLLK